MKDLNKQFPLNKKSLKMN